MRFISRSEAQSRFEGKRVAVVGSGPGVLGNVKGHVDSFDVVVRVNNYKLSKEAGFRCDVFASFFGSSIKKSAEDLKRDGVTLCLCKCPNADISEPGPTNPNPVNADWHRKHGKMIGLDYRPHYRRREQFWFCDTHVPTIAEFMESFRALDGHMPTSGFAAIFEVLLGQPRSVYLTGFDGFQSKIHNVNEPWREKNLDDPIRHRPDLELLWLKRAMANPKHQITSDVALMDAFRRQQSKAA